MSSPATRRLRAIILKELWAVLRDPRARLTLIVPPILQLFVLGYASTLEVKHFTVGIYDQDRGKWSREVVNRLAGSPDVRMLVPIDSERAARTALDDRKVIAIVTFGQTFSADIAAKRPAQVQALYDGRRSNATQIVNGYLSNIVGGISAELDSRERSGGKSEVTHWFNPNLDYLWFVLPALVVTIASLSVLSVTAQSVARERELGTFDQLLVSPLRTHEIVVGKVTPALLLGLFNSSVYLVLIPNVFGVPFKGSVGLFYLSLALFLVALIGVGLLVSVLAQSQQQAFLGMFLAVVPLILLSGFASPVDNMPGWLQALAQANPLKHFLIISEGLFLKGLPPAEVLRNLWPLMLIAMATLGGATLLFRSRLE